MRLLAEDRGWRYRRVRSPSGGKAKLLFAAASLPPEILSQVLSQSLPARSPPREPDSRPLDSYSEEARAVALDRAAVLKRLRAASCRPEEFAAAWNAGGPEEAALRGRLGPLSASTLRRWEARYQRSGLSGLCPRYASGERERGPGEFALSEEDRKLILTYYLLPQKPPLTVALSNIAQLHGRQIPYEPARRFVAGLPKPLLVRHRDGAKRAADRYEPTVRRSYSGLAAMEWVVSDHHTLDLLVAHEGRIFRPVLTAVVDMRARKLLGWWIDEIPSSLTILCALEQMGRLYGAPENALIDNGQDFRSAALQGAVVAERIWEDGVLQLATREVEGLFAELGCQVHYALPYNARSKSIERLFRDVCDYFSRNFSTYVGSNTVSKPEEVKRYYGRFAGGEKKEVRLTLEQVRAAFSNFAHWWNAHHHHRGQGMEGRTPDEVFAATWKEKREIPEAMVRLLFSEKIPARTVKANGIELDGILYYSSELWHHKGRQVSVRRPVRDIGEIYVYALSGEYLACARNDALAGAGATAMDIRSVQKARKAEREKMAEGYGWLPTYRANLPTMEEYLIHHLQAAGRIAEPAQVAQVVGLALPPELAREGLSVVRPDDAHKKPGRNLEMPY